jgi:colanic acid/amylovoran biosynthesis glycosyltransferase
VRSLHLLDSYLPRTETFIWQALRKLRRFPPLVAAERRENEAAFPLPEAEFLSLAPRRSLALRLLARARGDFAPASYSGAAATLRDRAVVCHVHKGTQALVTRGLTRDLGLPLLINFYGSDVSQRAFLRRARRGYRELFARARFLLVEGPAMRERLIGLGAPAERIRIQRIAIDVADYPLRARSWDGFRPVRLLHVGRMVEKKGLEVALLALAKTGEAFPWSLTVIGDGPLGARMRALADSLGLSGRVEFLGSRPLAEMRAALESHDLLLQPSRTGSDGDGEGGAPTVILEAQACGMPVITTDHDDIPFVTVPGESAWIAPQGDVAVLGETLRRAARESARWEAMGRAGRAKVERDHDAARVVSALEDLYAEALVG